MTATTMGAGLHISQNVRIPERLTELTAKAAARESIFAGSILDLLDGSRSFFECLF
jgi:hypothetical protein